MYICLQNESAQLWFENFTTLRVKYGLVKDLELRGICMLVIS